jgi:hypothetical protein
MKSANQIGCVGVALFVATPLLYLLPDPSGGWSTASISAQLLAFALCLFAGIRGSRWWFLHTSAYLLLLGYWVWLLSQGH